MLQTKAFPICEDYIRQINSGFVENGWLTLYKEGALYAVMVDDDTYQKEIKEDSWAAEWSNMRPSFQYDDGNTNVGGYMPLSRGGVYPIVITQELNCYYSFQARFVDEFILLYDLRTVQRVDGTVDYYLLDENGDETLVAKSSHRSFEAKVEYIKEFIAIKELHLVVQFSEVLYSNKTLKELGTAVKSSQLFTDQDVVFSYGTQDPIFESDGKSCAIIRGKFFIHPEKQSIKRLWDSRDDRFENFIIGIDDAGKKIISTCDEKKLPPLQPVPPSPAYQLSLVFFEDKVLEKYYKDSRKFTIQDGAISGPSWFAHLDDDHDDGYVVMVLKDLGKLPYKEQTHWRKFNVVPPKDVTLSNTTWKRWFAGVPSDPSQAQDIVFKTRYNQLNDKWKDKFGFPLFLPLAPGDEHYFDGIHCLTSLNNDSEFDDFVLSITKVFIDSLNEAQIVKLLDENNADVSEYLKAHDVKSGKVKDLSGGLNRIEALFVQNKMNVRRFMILLRKIQALRSAISAHRKKMEPKKKDLALYAWFGYDKNPHKDVVNYTLTMVNEQMQMLMDALDGNTIVDNRKWYEKLKARLCKLFGNGNKERR